MSPELKSHKKMEQGGLTEPCSSLKNKTGSWKSQKPVWDEKKCVHCQFCTVYCPDNCILMDKKGKRGETDLDYCKGCGICAKVCPVKAITMEKINKGEKK
jgi:2-oxoacid:acceptor oxidoreductase delta subunit (pyruvate/2-ketoisovalerate family)